MKNLFNRTDIDVASIPVNFNVGQAKGFEDVRGEYHAAYNEGHLLVVENGKIHPRTAVNFIYPQASNIEVNEGFFNLINGNPGEVGLLLDVVFQACGLHCSNAKANEVLKSIGDNIYDGVECELNGETVYRLPELYDYVFSVYYNGTVKTLRVYSVPKQGYLDFSV